MSEVAENRPDHMNEDDLRRALKTDRARLEQVEAGYRRELQAADRAGTEASILRAENERMRDVLTELNTNANNLLAGSLSWFTKRDFAQAVADRSKHGLGSRSEGDPRG